MENKFITYAGHWIIQSISRAIADYGFTIRVPVHMFENVNYIKRIMRDNEFETEAEMIEFIAKNKDVEESKVHEWLVVSKNIINPVSLNTPVGEDLDSQLVDFIASHEPPIESSYDLHSLRSELVECIDCLKEKESEIIKMRFGFDCEKMTLEEVGQKYQVTRERIRQIEAKALRKLTTMKKMKDLHIYLEE
jgi:RNA polymerase primary sigma factor